MISFKPRLYQETIFATASQKNTLVVLPTGMGKTNIFLMLAAHRLKLYPKSKILFIGPTRPLIDQYKQVFMKYFNIDEDKLAVFTGFVKPEKRQELWKKATVIFSTPQGLENDIITRRIDLSEVSLLGVDEAHRAVGDYAYVFIAKQYNRIAKYPRIVALTASPGSDMEKIQEVMQNLYIDDIEIRTSKSPDVKDYIQEVRMNWVKVEFPEDFKKIRKFLQTSLRTKLKEIKELGYLGENMGESRKDVLILQGRLQGEIAQGNKEFELLRSLSLAAEALKVQHAIELVETQGIGPLSRYLKQIEERSRTTKVKAVQNLMRDTNFRSAIILTDSLMEKNVEHPKLAKLIEIASKKLDSGQKMIIFNQYRDSGTRIVEEFAKHGYKAVQFVGQAKKNGTGLTQKEQLRILDEFREGKFNVLVSSSVGEEGLDIPQVDSVIFYEPVPSAIRHIQRRGRTARLEKGEVIILMTAGTRDEAYRWSAHHKENRMHRNLERLKKNLVLAPREQKLDKYIEKVKIIADYREKGSAVIKEIIDQAELELQQLKVGDYILSPQCCVEYKNMSDFVDSLVDGRLLQQVKDLKQNFPKPLIIVEGQQDMYTVRNIHPNAIRGLLATITVSYGVPLLQTKNSKDTAGLLLSVAKREQDKTAREFSLHSGKKPMSMKEQQEYIVSALPGVGMSLAKTLLKKFGSIKSVMNADMDSLKSVELIGDKKAGDIKELIDAHYG